MQVWHLKSVQIFFNLRKREHFKSHEIILFQYQNCSAFQIQFKLREVEKVETEKQFSKCPQYFK